MRPFNALRFKYNWHWFWDTGNGDIGNQGVHEMDIARWGLGEVAWPKSVVSTGGKYVYNDDQETPNTQFASFDYGDKELQFEVRGLNTGGEGNIARGGGNYVGNLFYGADGWMVVDGNGFKVYKGDKDDLAMEREEGIRRRYPPAHGELPGRVPLAQLQRSPRRRSHRSDERRPVPPGQRQLPGGPQAGGGRREGPFHRRWRRRRQPTADARKIPGTLCRLSPPSSPLPSAPIRFPTGCRRCPASRRAWTPRAWSSTSSARRGIDLPTDGELYRFDVNHPDTNGMIEYFIRPMAGVRTQVGRSDHEAFARMSTMRFRRKAAGVVEGPLGEGSLNLLADCELAAGVAGGPFKFTVTSPYMLARTLLDRHYGDFEDAADGDRRRAGATGGRPSLRVPADRRSQHPRQPGRRPRWPPPPSIACSTLSRARRAVHLCFGNYGGQTIQKGEWRALVGFPEPAARRSPGAGDGAPPARAIWKR